MSASGLIAAFYERVSAQIVALNPVSRLNPWLLRNHPLVWRIRMGLVVSYALAVSAALYLIGGAEPVGDIREVPAVLDLESRVWSISLVSLLVLSPWINRNFRTGVENGNWRTALKVLLGYLACFAALNLVPSSYYIAKIERLDEFARPGTREVAQQLNSKRLLADAADWPPSPADFTRQKEIARKLGPVAAKYGLEICVSSDLGHDLCGTQPVAIELHRMSESAGEGNFLPADPLFFSPVGTGNASRVQLNRGEFVGALQTLGHAQEFSESGIRTPRHPLHPQRIFLVFVASLIATYASVYHLLPPRSPTPRIPGLRGFARFLERMTGRHSGNFAKGIRPRRRQLAFAMVPPALLVLAAATVYFVSDTYLAGEGTSDSLSLGGVVIASVTDLLTLLAMLAVGAITVFWTRSFYRRFPFPLVMSLRNQFYLPLLVSGVLVVSGFLLMMSLSYSLDFALTIILALALVLMALVLTVEGCWFGSYVRWSLEGKARPGGLVVAMRALAYLALLCGLTFGAYALSSLIDGMLFLGSTIPFPENPSGMSLSGLANEYSAILAPLLKAFALVILLTAASRLYWFTVGKRHLIAARLGLLALFFGFGGFVLDYSMSGFIAFSNLWLSDLLSRNTTAQLVHLAVSWTLMAAILALLFVWLFRPFHAYWGRQIYEPQLA